VPATEQREVDVIPTEGRAAAAVEGSIPNLPVVLLAQAVLDGLALHT
jgi:hypothetical protein